MFGMRDSIRKGVESGLKESFAIDGSFGKALREAFERVAASWKLEVARLKGVIAERDAEIVDLKARLASSEHAQDTQKSQ